jgi:hypothetical protein
LLRDDRSDGGTGPAKAAAPDDAVVMNPFVISTGRDAGFVAASSLAGGRLAGDLKDTPVAYSVQTREFIDALGLDSVTEASKWSGQRRRCP